MVDFMDEAHGRRLEFFGAAHFQGRTRIPSDFTIIGVEIIFMLIVDLDHLIVGQLGEQGYRSRRHGLTVRVRALEIFEHRLEVRAVLLARTDQLEIVNGLGTFYRGRRRGRASRAFRLAGLLRLFAGTAQQILDEVAQRIDNILDKAFAARLHLLRAGQFALLHGGKILRGNTAGAKALRARDITGQRRMEAILGKSALHRLERRAAGWGSTGYLHHTPRASE
ncbi:hypothetical protein DMP17_05500 [Pseudonocardia sp. TMWB2A]